MRKSNFLIAIIVLSSFLPMYVPSVKAIRYMPFTVGVLDLPQNIDPANASNSVSYKTLNQVYEGLYAYNLSSPSMEAIPQLASKMGVWNENMTELTIELRDDVTFHDGSAFNATAVKWNFDRINYFAANNMSNPTTLYLNNNDELIVKEIVIVNNTAIKFILNRPFSIWEQILAFTGSYIIKPNENFRETFLSLSDEAIGTGPFKMGEITPDKSTMYPNRYPGSVLFERYMDYYHEPANISTMVYTLIKDGEVASIAILNHELHYGGVLWEHIEAAEADPDITIERVKTSVVLYLQLSVINIPHEVRRAMSFGFDYSYFLEQTLKNESFELHTPIPDGMKYHNPDIEGLPYYNKTIARQYMLNCPNITDFQGLTIDSPDADWIAVANGANPLFDANFTRSTSTLLQKVSLQLQDNFTYIGIHVTDTYGGGYWCGSDTWCGLDPEPVDPKFMQISMGGWGPDYNDAINMIEPIYKTNATNNDVGYTNDTLDTLFSQNYELTGDNRTDSFDNIVYKLMVENCPSMYLYQRGDRRVYNNKYVSNIQDLLNVFDNWYWYNVIYSPQEDPGIPGFTLGYTLIACLGAVVLVLFVVKKRRFLTRILRGY